MSPSPIAPVLTHPVITVLKPAHQKQLSGEVMKNIAKNMGVPVGDLPGDVQKEVDEQIKASLTDSIRELARVHVTQQVKGELTKAAPIQSIMADRIKGALTGVSLVSQNADAKAIMAENAKLLRAKYDALVAVQFTADQAFQILLTELGKPRR